MAKERERRSRRVAALLAIVVVGMFGAHKFYIGNARAGVLHIVALFASVLLSNAIGMELPFALVGAFSCVRGIIYALRSDDEFSEQYVYGGRVLL